MISCALHLVGGLSHCERKLRISTSVNAKFSSILHKKIYFFLFYTPIFTKHTYQFIYFAHLCNKIFIPLQFFIILSLTDPTLSHRPNTQKKVAVVFVDVRAPLFLSASGSGGPVIKMALLLGLVFLCSY